MENIQCENCKSYKVVVYDRKTKFLFGVGFSLVGVILALMFNNGGFYVLLGIIGGCCVFIGIAYLILALAHGTTKARCKSCANKWSIDYTS